MFYNKRSNSADSQGDSWDCVLTPLFWETLILMKGASAPQRYSEFYALKGFWLLNNHNLQEEKADECLSWRLPLPPTQMSVYNFQPRRYLTDISVQWPHFMEKKTRAHICETPSLRSDKHKERSANLRSSDSDSEILILWFFFPLRRYFFLISTLIQCRNRNARVLRKTQGKNIVKSPLIPRLSWSPSKGGWGKVTGALRAALQTHICSCAWPGCDRGKLLNVITKCFTEPHCGEPRSDNPKKTSP